MTKPVTVKARCNAGCGEIALQPSGLHLVVYDSGTGSYYEFFCPGCRRYTRKPADVHVQKMLVQGGVPCDYEHVPYEMLEHHDGPLLTEDDLLDFAQDLASIEAVSLQADIDNFTT